MERRVSLFAFFYKPAKGHIVLDSLVTSATRRWKALHPLMLRVFPDIRHRNRVFSILEHALFVFKTVVVSKTRFLMFSISLKTNKKSDFLRIMFFKDRISDLRPREKSDFGRNKIVTRNNRLAAIRSMARMILLMVPENKETADRILNIPSKRHPRPLFGFLSHDEALAVVRVF